jgi:hypothetical protein
MTYVCVAVGKMLMYVLVLGACQFIGTLTLCFVGIWHMYSQAFWLAPLGALMAANVWWSHAVRRDSTC